MKILKKHKTTIILSTVVSVTTCIVMVTLFATVYRHQANIFPPLSHASEKSITDETQYATPRDYVREESRIIDIVEQSNPAVVSIVITKDVPVIEQYYEELDPFEDFFGGSFGFRVPRQRQNGTEKREVGGGSGFFISSDGLLVTNRHVVNDKDAEYTILTNSGETYNAKVLARDTTFDIAVLKVESKGFSYLEFGDSDNIKAGQTVIAIGNALTEFQNSVSVGVVSGLSRSIIAGSAFGKSEMLEGVIQTDAAINPGNSGGPLLDLNGKVIGVNVAVQRGAENIGFALSGNTVKTIVTSVQEHGEIIKPYLGIRYITITEHLQKKNDLPVAHGALVARGETREDLAVIPGSPADIAGIMENDIILEIDGVKIERGASLSTLIRQKQVSQSITLAILRHGTEKQITATLKKAPTE